MSLLPLSRACFSTPFFSPAFQDLVLSFAPKSENGLQRTDIKGAGLLQITYLHGIFYILCVVYVRVAFPALSASEPGQNSCAGAVLTLLRQTIHHRVS